MCIFQDWIDKFDLRFEQTFHLANKGFNASAVRDEMFIMF